jgi:hypothetical protein
LRRTGVDPGTGAGAGDKKCVGIGNSNPEFLVDAAVFAGTIPPLIYGNIQEIFPSKKQIKLWQ